MKLKYKNFASIHKIPNYGSIILVGVVNNSNYFFIKNIAFIYPS